MSFLKRLLLSQSPVRPRLYETDEIQPVHILDDVNILAEYDLFWIFPFREVLDADLLGRSLSEVIETGDWRRLGGRFRRNAAGRTEIHIPTPFKPSRPPIHSTKEHFDQLMNDHPIASQLPVASQEAQLYPSSRALVPLAYGPGAPRTMAERLAHDVPQIGLHVVTFRDGTILSVSWNHITCDLGGFIGLIKAWVAHLHGQPIPDFMSKDDAMRHLYEDPPQNIPLVIQDMLLSGWRKAIWIAQFLWDQWWTTSTFTTQQVCIPKQRMDALLQKCRKEASEAAREFGGNPFISEGDVFVALGTRGSAKSMPPSTGRTVTTLNAVDPRGRFPDIYKKNTAHVQNMTLAIALIRPAREILDTKLGALALSLRRSIEHQLTEPQMRLSAANLYNTVVKTGSYAMAGDATTFISTSTNWSKARLLDIFDLGPAVIATGRGTRTKSVENKALPVSFHATSNMPGNFTTSVMVTRGRDHHGDMWLEGEMGPDGWADMLSILNSDTAV
ncbi:transferase family protein [Sarocladium implicatum]|nr:transferase family protein [Sarocladium implicatum]